MKPDHVYLGQIVSQNMRRCVESVRYHVLTVPLCEIVENGVTWQTAHRAGAGRQSWETLEGAKECAERIAAGGLDAAVLILACGDGPMVSWAADPHVGPASAVVVEMWTSPKMVPYSPVPCFPGLSLVAMLVEALYPLKPNQEATSGDPA